MHGILQRQIAYVLKLKDRLGSYSGHIFSKINFIFRSQLNFCGKKTRVAVANFSRARIDFRCWKKQLFCFTPFSKSIARLNISERSPLVLKIVSKTIFLSSFQSNDLYSFKRLSHLQTSKRFVVDKFDQVLIKSELLKMYFALQWRDYVILKRRDFCVQTSSEQQS